MLFFLARVSLGPQESPGWEVVIDLVRKLAAMLGEEAEPDPAAWFRERYAEEPNYSRLLEAVAKSPAERRQLLRSYFEPSEEEREQGLKLPTVAHSSIAQLVASGHIRVILTTNFDRLQETAIQAVGITPAVISSEDAAKGALPLAHSTCTIIKVNGDYLDTRLKNTPNELASYGSRMNRLLDQLLDEHGLVVCGWSAEWDTALRGAFLRANSRRFTTYWASRGERTEAAQGVIDARRALVISIEDGDTFFQEVLENTQSLDALAAPHPLSARVAVETLKRYIVDDRNRIRLYDLITTEVEKLYASMHDDYFDVNANFSREEFPEKLIDRVQRYEAYTNVLLNLMATGGYWGNESHFDLWCKCIERAASGPDYRSWITAWRNLERYPALLLLYGAGLGALAAGRYSTLLSLFTKVNVLADNNTERSIAAAALIPPQVMELSMQRQLPGMAGHHTPLSERLFGLLRDPLRVYLPDDSAYQQAFDRFECLISLACFEFTEGRWMPLGCFAWRGGFRRSFTADLIAEANEAGDAWPPLTAGFFGGSIEGFNAVANPAQTFVTDWSRTRW